MKKDELIDFYEGICEIGRDYGAEIDIPSGDAQYEYIRSSLNTLANLSENFEDESNFYTERKNDLRHLADDISKVNQSLSNSHSVEAGILLYNLTETVGVETDVSEKDFTPIGRGPKEALKALVDDYLED